MPSNHLILCRPLLLPPSIFPSIRVFSNESILRTRWPKYWSFSFNNCPSNEDSALDRVLEPQLQPQYRSPWPSHFILPGAVSNCPPLSQEQVGPLPAWGTHLSMSYLLPFCTVHGVLVASIPEWSAVPHSSGPRLVRTLHHDPSILGGPTRRGSQLHWVTQAPSPWQGCDPWGDIMGWGRN